jgi:hypothetical protein
MGRDPATPKERRIPAGSGAVEDGVGRNEPFTPALDRPSRVRHEEGCRAGDDYRSLVPLRRTIGAGIHEEGVGL